MGNADTSDAVARVADVIKQHALVGSGTPVLLMVSGGSDSTALAYVAHDLQAQDVLGEVALLHVNHKLRGQDADEDARFVEGLAALLGMPFFLRDVDVANRQAETGENLEALARHERYHAAEEILDDMCGRAGVRVEYGRIFTAHTADDRVENFYMRSIVGTGPGGFRSMRYLNGHIARPLLDESRESLRAYIEARANAGLPVMRDGNDDCGGDDGRGGHDGFGGHGALWREDATNSQTDRFRAYVRHEIVPRAKEWNEQLLDVLVRSMNLIADEDDMLDAMADDLESCCVKWEPADNESLCESVADADADADADTDTARDDIADSAAQSVMLLPDFGCAQLALKRRVIYKILRRMLDEDARIENASIEAILNGFSNGKPQSGYVVNIQGNLAVSANVRGVRIEPMANFRARRKKG